MSDHYKAGDRLNEQPYTIYGGITITPPEGRGAMLSTRDAEIANAARQEAFAEIDAAAKKVDPERFIHRRLIDPRECAFVADLSAALLAASKGEGDE